MSRALRTISNWRNQAISNWDSLILPCMGVMWTLGLKAEAVLAATYTADVDIRIKIRLRSVKGIGREHVWS